MILGTAGHVDHGKTALVKALTGVDTDRLAEEKRRGITIDLGFAPLRLAGGRTLSVVDVPGHEAFVRNMLAGATGMDLALLVVAADEGVMPQTREHVAILDLLGISGGVVALTKCDLVDGEWLALVTEDVRVALAGTVMRDAPIVATSAVTGQGLDDLRAAISAAADRVAERDATDLFRVPVDRVFTVRGTGTVVTGTVWSGRLEREATVRILPNELRARVRGLESHGAVVDAVLPGMRAAIALAGVTVAQLGRGASLVVDDAWRLSRLLLAQVALLPTVARALGPRTAVRFHLGTADVGARIVKSGGPVAPGERASVRVVLEEPVVARAGDRFVLRGGSPLVTIGGGMVDDPQPPHRRSRPWSLSARAPADRLRRLLEIAGTHGVERAPLAVRLGAAPRKLDALVASLEPNAFARVIGERLFSVIALDQLAAEATSIVERHHVRHAMDQGVPIDVLRAALGVDAPVAEAVLNDLRRSGVAEMSGALVMRSGWAPSLSGTQQDGIEALRGALQEAGRAPPSVGELQARFGPDTLQLLRTLERTGAVVAVDRDRYYAAFAVRDMLAILQAGMLENREYSPAELRDLLGLTRKFLIPFLEYCDRTGYTERRAGGRVPGPRRPAADVA